MTEVVITGSPETVVVLTEVSSPIIATAVESLIVPLLETVEACRQGPPGPPGPGGASEFDVLAGTPLSAHRAVRLQNDQAFYCDGDNPAHVGSAVGVTVSAAVAGQSVRVQAVGGPIVDAAWTWSPGPLYVGAGGVLSATPGAAFVQEVARVQAPTKIMVGLRLAVLKG